MLVALKRAPPIALPLCPRSISAAGNLQQLQQSFQLDYGLHANQTYPGKRGKKDSAWCPMHVNYPPDNDSACPGGEEAIAAARCSRLLSSMAAGQQQPAQGCCLSTLGAQTARFMWN